MRKDLVALLFLTAAALLQGCVRNQLVRQETQAFAKTADEAAIAGTKFYADGLVKSDRSFYSTLTLLDSSCHPPSIGGPVYLDLKANSRSPTKWCGDEKSADVYKLSAEFTYESFEREFAALDFTATYIAALSELAADPESKASEQFTNATADLGTLLTAAGGEPKWTDDQIKATGEFLDLLQNLANDKKSAQEIRALLTSDGVRVATYLEMLANALLSDQQFANEERRANKEILFHALAFRMPPDPFLRGALLSSYNDALDAERSAVQAKKKCENKAKAKPDVLKYCGATAAGLMHAAASAHKDLMNLAAGHLNAEQKAKEAKLAYARFMSVVRLFVSVVAAF